jgi:aldehyde dehydrogenase (NAD+)
VQLTRERDAVFVGGQWLRSTSADRLTLINPATEDPFATVPDSSAAVVDAAVSAARDSLAEWSNTSVEERVAALERIAEEVENRRDEIGETVSTEMGAPFPFARRANADGVAVTLRYSPLWLAHRNWKSHAPRSASTAPCAYGVRASGSSASSSLGTTRSA